MCNGPDFISKEVRELDPHLSLQRDGKDMQASMLIPSGKLINKQANKQTADDFSAPS